MLTKDKRYELVVKLGDRTEAGSVPWEMTALNGVFQAAFPNYVVRLGKRRSQEPDENPDYGLTILNRQGQVIDEFWDVDFDYTPSDESAGVGRPYLIMEALYSTARRQALGVDKAVDELLKELDDDVPF